MSREVQLDKARCKCLDKVLVVWEQVISKSARWLLDPLSISSAPAWDERFIHVAQGVEPEFSFQLQLEGNEGRNPVGGLGQRRGNQGRNNRDEVEGSRTPKLPLWAETGTDLLTRAG